MDIGTDVSCPHEARYCQRSDDKAQKRIYEFFLQRTQFINNRDLVQKAVGWIVPEALLPRNAALRVRTLCRADAERYLRGLVEARGPIANAY